MSLRVIPSTAATVAAVLAALATPSVGHGSPVRESGLVVAFAHSTGPAERAAALTAAGVVRVRSLALDDTVLVVPRPGTGTDSALSALRDAAGVRYAEPDAVLRPAAVAAHELEPSDLPSDPLVAEQWGLHNTGQSVGGVAGVTDLDIDAPGGWRVPGGADGAVAILDTGVAHEHEDLADVLWGNPAEQNGTMHVDDDGNGRVDDRRGWDFVDDDNDPDDPDGHGTKVASIVAARQGNGLGLAGVAPRGRILPLRVADTSGQVFASDIADALQYADAMGVRVALLAFVTAQNSQALSDAIAAVPNVLVVTAAGNEGVDLDTPSERRYPCAFPLANVVCTGGFTNTGAYTGNHGTAHVDLAAPAVRVRTADALGPVIFSEDFTNLAGWSASTLSGGAAVPWGVRGPEAPFDGTFLSDTPVGNYGNGVDSALTLATTVEPPTAADCRLTYVAGWHLGAGDSVRIQFRVRAAGSFGPWKNAATLTGDSAGVRSRNESLGTYVVGLVDALQVRIRLTSDAAGTGDGIDLDRIRIRCTSPTAYALGSGTSLAAAHVAGVAAHLKSIFPGHTAGALRTNLLAGVQPVPAFGQAVATSGVLSAARAIDRHAPAAPALTAPEADAVTTDPGVAFSWAAASDGSGSGVDRYALVVDGTLAALTPSLTSGAGTLAPGLRRWTVAAVDRVGNFAFAPQRDLTVAESAPPAAPPSAPAPPAAPPPAPAPAAPVPTAPVAGTAAEDLLPSVVAPFLPSVQKDLAVDPRRRRAQAWVVCLLQQRTRCPGTVTLQVRRGRTWVAAGRASFSAAAGTQRRVDVSLGRVARRLLGRTSTLKARLRIATGPWRAVTLRKLAATGRIGRARTLSVRIVTPPGWAADETLSATLRRAGKVVARGRTRARQGRVQTVVLRMSAARLRRLPRSGVYRFTVSAPGLADDEIIDSRTLRIRR